MATVGLVGLAACSADTGDFRSDAESFIEDSDDLADATGQTFTDAVCVEPARVEVDEVFSCTAVTDDGTTWEFTATITGDDGYLITSAGPAAGTADSAPAHRRVDPTDDRLTTAPNAMSGDRPRPVTAHRVRGVASSAGGGGRCGLVPAGASPLATIGAATTGSPASGLDS